MGVAPEDLELTLLRPIGDAAHRGEGGAERCGGLDGVAGEGGGEKYCLDDEAHIGVASTG